MEQLNCLRCAYRHEDNGNCTAAGGFCTAVPAAHCRLLQEYLGTGLTPDGVEALKLSMMGKAVAEIKEFDVLPIDRLKELAEADKEGRVVVLPCKVGDTVYMISWRLNGRHEIEERVFSLTYFDPAKYGKDYFLAREEAEEALRRAENA